jgi:hypothetical protein
MLTLSTALAAARERELLRAAEQQGRPRAHRRSSLNRRAHSAGSIAREDMEAGEPFMNARLQPETLRCSGCS